MLEKEIIKSVNDNRKYRLIRLENGLRALLISSLKNEDSEEPVTNNNTTHDEDSMEEEEEENEEEAMETDGDVSNDSGESSDEDEDDEINEKMSSASLSISAGSFLDPDELPGLAHLVEHMVFMGSKKYPKENAYDEYVNKHGGFNNASTDNEETNFVLDINRKYFERALDMLANFFISPLMLKNSLDREIEAVDSEFTLGIPKDDVRHGLILAQQAKPGHPMQKFNWGNKDTLKVQPELNNIEVYQRLHEFQKKYYVAQFMTLAIQSMDSLDHLEDMVKRIFQDIPSSDLKKPSFEDHPEPFATESFTKLYKILPVTEVNKVILTWSLPSLLKEYRIKPLHLISAAIEDEGKGSLLACLREKGWALKLNAGNSEDGFEHNTTHALFDISILLSKEGLEHISEVLILLFEYLQMLRESDWLPLYKELKIIRYNNFLWNEEEQTSDYVEGLSHNLHFYDEEHCIVGDVLFFDYSKELVSQCLQSLGAHNVNVTILSNSFLPDSLPLKETRTTAQYSVEDIPEEWKKGWTELKPNPSFHMPLPNRFIASDFDISEPDKPPTKYPIKLLGDKYGTVWYKKDDKFNTPKAFIYLNLVNPLLRKSAKNGAMMNLFIACFYQNISLDCYSALCADLDYTFIQNNQSGISIKLNGFNHKLPLLLEAILNHIMGFTLKKDFFEIMKIQLAKDYANTLAKPNKFGSTILGNILDHDRFDTCSKLKALSDVTQAELEDFVKEFFSSLFIVSLYQGNLTSKEVIEFNKMLKTILKYTPLEKNAIPKLKVWKIPKADSSLRLASLNSNNINTSVCNYYQYLPYSIPNKCFLELLNLNMGEPLFDQLRTKEQLGYDVCSYMSVIHKILGIKVQIISPSNKFSCIEIDKKIEDFIKSFCAKHLKEKKSLFEEQVANLITVKETVDVSLLDEVDRHWEEVLGYENIFDRKTREIEYLQTFKHDDYKKWVKKLLFSPSKISVQIVGKHEAEKYLPAPNEDNEAIKHNYLDIDANKKESKIYNINEFMKNQEVYDFIQIS